MKIEDQETLNETFLGKEDPDLAFKKPMTNNLKEEIKDLMGDYAQAYCGSDRYVSKEEQTQNDIDMSIAMNKLLALINQKEKELLEKVHCGMCGSHFLVDSTPGPFGQDQEETINMQDVVNKQLKEELKGGQDE